MNNPAIHPAFLLNNTRTIESLNIRIEEYTHQQTGAQHIHLSADNPENVFIVALRTVPHDSTGVAHILEHTALCGSEKYPVRDPFFMMIRRSLNTFMNAFTSSDWTAYPFASQNRKDFSNLLNVYLDAVFFSRLDELDFLQEGHRLEFSDAENPESPLTFKGVVFNEMKGAMSSTPSVLWHTFCKYLYPTTTYHYNSGGDPEAITDLSYQQLVDFYRTHYHPSNAIFMTFGDIPAAEHQAVFEAQALKRFQKLDKHIAVGSEKRYLAPITVEEFYALDEPGSTAHKTHIVVGWLLGEATDLQASMEAQLLNYVLFDNSASPLQKALETTKLGSAPSPLCGLDNSQKEMCFICGIEGSEPEHAQALEQLVLETLEKVAEQGVPKEQVEACLHQLELQQREITGDSYPYGLQLILGALTNATHRGDPAALLDLEPAIAKLRDAIEDPDYIKNLTRTLLLDNPHRVRLTLKPDQQLSAKKIAAEQKQLSAIKASLDDDAKHRLIEQARRLKARQEQQDDASILPKVTLEDIPKQLNYVAPESTQQSPVKLTRYGVGTNGLVYQQIIVPLPELTHRQLELLPLYAMSLSELGVGNKDYLETQLWQSKVCGDIHGFASAHATPDSLHSLKGHLVLSAKGLSRHQPEMTELMQHTLESVRFDELPRIRELIAQTRARREMSVTSNGHVLAMTAAASGISPGAGLSHQWGGLQGLQMLKALDKTLDVEANLELFAIELAELHQTLMASEKALLLIGETEKNESYQAVLEQHVNASVLSDQKPFHLDSAPQQVAQLWQASTQVNFCAKAYPTVPMGHPDAAALSVLGGFLRNGYLHRVIREQGGAYGGGASQDNSTGAFRFYSYRDPRIEETLTDFDQSIHWLKNTKHSFDPVEEAILGVISSIDKPGSPAGEAKQTFHAELYGKTREKREAFRRQVTEVTMDELVRVTDTYLQPEKASSAVITSPDNAAKLDHLAMQTLSL